MRPCQGRDRGFESRRDRYRNASLVFVTRCLFKLLMGANLPSYIDSMVTQPSKQKKSPPNRNELCEQQQPKHYFPALNLLWVARIQVSMTTSNPASRAVSAAISLMTPSCIQTTLAPISIA